MEYSKVLITALKIALKASNQRIVTLDNNFGSNSSLVKNTLSFLEKGAFKQYTARSNEKNIQTPTNTGTQFEDRISHTKINISKVIQDIQNGNFKESDLQTFLIQTTGKKIVNGELQQVAQGIPTMTSLKKEYERQYDIDLKKLSKKDLINELNERAESLSNFQTEYEVVKDNTTLAERQQKYPFLFHSGKRWDYGDMMEVAQCLKEMRENVQTTIFNNNKIAQSANKKLKNGV